MRPHYKPLATALAATLQLALHAAVPLSWDARPGNPAPASFDRYHGEAIDFSATFRGFGELPFAPGADIRLWYQTNGMGSAWWSVPATIQSNVLSATWSPALDPGADRVSLFFGAPSNAYAAAVLRLRHSPGFAPGSMPDPETFHESDPVFTAWLAAFSESDPVFSSWLEGYTPPETSLEPSTNYTDRALGAFATTGTVRNAKSANNAAYATQADIATFAYNLYNPQDWTSWTVVTLLKAATNYTDEAIANIDIPPATDLSPIEQDIADLRTESALVYRLYSGSNVVAEVTNHNSQVHAPELRLMQLNESNEYVTVWTETNGLARTLATATKYTDDATNALPEVYAPRAWSRTTSGLGADVPDGETWITTPKVYVTGGLEYHQTIDAYGAVWVLCSNGMTPEYSPDTNAYFRISADDGTPIFSIEKTDAMVVGANAAGITVGESSIVIPVPVVSPDPPTMYWRQHLDSGDWADESSPPTGSTVTWTGEAGARVCTISFSGTRPSSLFFRFTFLQPGGVVIRNKAITDLSQGIIVNGTNYVPTVSGNNLIWTRQQ